MFLRFTSRTNADGAVVRYVALAHNRRVDGQVRPDVLMRLGRVDQVDVAGLHRLAASIGRHFGGGAATPRVVDVRAIGTVWLLDGVWQQLGLGAAMGATGRLERTLFALVAYDAMAPAGGRSAAEWVRDEVAVPGLSTVDDRRAARARELLAAVPPPAPLLIRAAEEACGRPWPDVDRLLGRIAQVTLHGPDGPSTQIAPLSPEQAAVYAAVGVTAPATPGRSR